MSSGAGTHDFTVTRGQTDQRTIRPKDENDVSVDLTGATIVFRATGRRGVELLRKSSDDDLTVRPADGEIDLFFTPAETRLFPVGRLTKYSIERRIGGNEFPFIKGMITAEEGPNDDG